MKKILCLMMTAVLLLGVFITPSYASTLDVEIVSIECHGITDDLAPDEPYIMVQKGTSRPYQIFSGFMNNKDKIYINKRIKYVGKTIKIGLFERDWTIEGDEYLGHITIESSMTPGVRRVVFTKGTGIYILEYKVY